MGCYIWSQKKGTSKKGDRPLYFPKKGTGPFFPPFFVPFFHRLMLHEIAMLSSVVCKDKTIAVLE
jgi:hypothetical protein